MTEYDIEHAGDTDTRTPDENGVAYYRFRASEVNGPTVKVRSHGDDGFVSAPATWSYRFYPWPGVKSDVYSDSSTEPTGGVGVEGTFTFSPPPGWTTATAYRYRFGRGEKTDIPADDNGKATLVWAPTESGSHNLQVWAVKADGTVSDYANDYSFEVRGQRPE